MGANLFTIPASVPFAEALARGIVRQYGADPLALSDVRIYLPTRRATRTLADVFTRLEGAALLPEMRPLGDVDEDELLFDAGGEALDIPAAIDPIRRRLLLAALIRKWHEKTARPDIGFAQAVAMAKGLASFLDEAETQNADLSKLEELAPASFAEHWGDVRDFLCIVRDQWPSLLAAEQRIDPADRRNRALARLRDRLIAHPPQTPVIAAGSTGSIPATAALLGAIARLPNGAVVLPGLDQELDDESWEKLDEDPGHPQFGLKQLLTSIGARRGDVKPWPSAPANAAREMLLREALRPPPTTDNWLALAERGRSEIEQGLAGISLIEAAHPREEAAAIACVLREALETPARTAALVTPDRNLARRVAAEMQRWGIAIDDSGGQPLAHAPAGAFLCLLAEAAEAAFAPAQLLALLKHPLAAGGIDAVEFRRHARLLDRVVLRGPRPDPGLAGVARAIDSAFFRLRRDDGAARDDLRATERWFDRLARMLAPLAELQAGRAAGLREMLAAHIGCAEHLAATDAANGRVRLWKGPAGERAARLVEALHGAAGEELTIEPNAYAPLFRALAEEIAVRPAYGQHPRLAVLGALEARLQSFDVVVLGGLNEGTWPRAAATDPWLSRPMRRTLGLEAPERAIGLSAHDFTALASGPAVYLSRAVKVEGAPTVASRWLQRLTQLSAGLGLAGKIAADAKFPAIARRLDEPDAIRPASRPGPTPPVSARPRRLSVTEIEKWLRDPYEIYAKHVLRLRALDPLDAEIGALERGNAVHEALERFLTEFPDALPQWAEARLVAIADEVFAEARIPHSVLALWKPRFRQAAHWFLGAERARRANIARSFAEVRGEYAFKAKAGEFRLFGFADRIDELKSGGAAIIDYKTGTVSSATQVKILLAPQLPLEGVILKEGEFANVPKLKPEELLYIKFSGGREPGKTVHIDGDIAALVSKAKAKLVARVDDFDRREKPYHAQVMPVDTRRKSDYEHLERLREWLAGAWEDEL